jgi:site-specific DNA-methyltransferase (adenine-specific)|tara:strand:- start:61 stop:942 length:882 start_codon:yes stop_codon:yes gene_type:complete
MNKRYKIYNNDCLKELPLIDNNSIDFVAIDPPYGIDVMNVDWDDDKIEKRSAKSKNSSVGKLPVGMKFDPKDAKKLGVFLNQVAIQLLQKLKPGAFCVVFSQPRAAHHVAAAFEEAGFEIRDQLIWNYGAGQGKAQGLQNFIRKNRTLTSAQKNALIERFDGLKTPQLTPVFETMWLAQKPRDGTFLQNYLKHGVGLVDFREKKYRVSFEHPKPRKKERELAGKHPTLKPLSLMEELIKVFSPRDGVVLDCFAGSGTTGVASLCNDRRFIGIEKSDKWFEIMTKRLADSERQQ